MALTHITVRKVCKSYSSLSKIISALSVEFQKTEKALHSSSPFTHVHTHTHTHTQHTHTHTHRQTPTCPHKVKEFVLYAVGGWEKVPEKGPT